MKYRKACAAACAAVLTASVLLPQTPESAGAADGKLTVMCIGDSITDGYGITGSYRKFLYHWLTEDGYTVEMTGDSGDNQGYLTDYSGADGVQFSYDNDHSGHSGFSILSYSGRSGIYEQIKTTDCIAEYKPDIVILQIGTNDAIDCHELENAGERLTVLITYILAEMPQNAVLLVTEIPDVQPNRPDVRTWFNSYRYSETWQEYSDEETAQRVKAGFDLYNQVLCETVSALEKQHDNLYLCHVNRTLDDLTAQLNDGVHPNDAGYARMGAYWTETVEQYLAGTLQHSDGQSTSSTTAITVTETTETTSSTDPVVFFPLGSGDINGDKSIALADAVLLQRFLICDITLTNTQLCAADLDGDRYINAKDLTLLKQKLLSMSGMQS